MALKVPFTGNVVPVRDESSSIESRESCEKHGLMTVNNTRGNKNFMLKIFVSILLLL